MSEAEVNTPRTPKKPALGRGLGSLLGVTAAPEAVEQPQSSVSHPVGGAPEEMTAIEATQNGVAPRVPPEARVWQIDIDKISPNDDQPRKEFKQEHLQSLAASIKEKGILQPILVRKRDDATFEIIAGERRWRAAQLAGVHRVPVLVRNADDQNSLELALIENIQRQDLNIMEEALAYRHLIDEYEMTQQQLADRIGKDRVSVANTLRLLNLTPEVQEMVSSGLLSMGHAKVLLAVENPSDQLQIARKVLALRLTVRATEKMVESKKNGGEEDETAEDANRSPYIKALSAELQKLIGSKVAIDYKAGRGSLTIKYYSDAELNELADALRLGWLK